MQTKSLLWLVWTSLCGDGKHWLLLSLKLSVSGLQDWGVLLQVWLLALVGNLLRKKGSVLSRLGLADPPCSWGHRGLYGHGWPVNKSALGLAPLGDPCSCYTKHIFVSFTEFVKDSGSIQLLRIFGFVVFIFSADFCPIWAETNFKNSHFLTDWVSSLFG